VLLTPLCLGWGTCRAEGIVWSQCPLLSASVFAGLTGRSAVKWNQIVTAEQKRFFSFIWRCQGEMGSIIRGPRCLGFISAFATYSL